MNKLKMVFFATAEESVGHEAWEGNREVIGARNDSSRRSEVANIRG